jgi:hypothetical protein
MNVVLVESVFGNHSDTGDVYRRALGSRTGSSLEVIDRLPNFKSK